MSKLSILASVSVAFLCAHGALAAKPLIELRYALNDEFSVQYCVDTCEGWGQVGNPMEPGYMYQDSDFTVAELTDNLPAACDSSRPYLQRITTAWQKRRNNAVNPTVPDPGSLDARLAVKSCLAAIKQRTYDPNQNHLDARTIRFWQDVGNDVAQQEKKEGAKAVCDSKGKPSAHLPSGVTDASNVADRGTVCR